MEVADMEVDTETEADTERQLSPDGNLARFRWKKIGLPSTRSCWTMVCPANLRNT